MTLPLSERRPNIFLGDRIRDYDFGKRHSPRIEGLGDAIAQCAAVALLPIFQMSRKGPASASAFPGLRPERRHDGAGRAALPFPISESCLNTESVQSYELKQIWERPVARAKTAGAQVRFGWDSPPNLLNEQVGFFSWLEENLVRINIQLGTLNQRVQGSSPCAPTKYLNRCSALCEDALRRTSSA